MNVVKRVDYYGIKDVLIGLTTAMTVARLTLAHGMTG